MAYRPSPIDEMPAGPDLDALCAEKVMGWHVRKTNPYWWFDRTAGPAESVERWQPSKNLGQAFKVQAELAKPGQIILDGEETQRGYWMKLTSPFDPNDLKMENPPLWWAGFTPHSTTGWNGRPDWQAPGETAALAIVRAALKVKTEEPTL